MQKRAVSLDALYHEFVAAGIGLVLKVDGARPVEHQRPWTVVLSGAMFGEAGAVRGDFASLWDGLDFAMSKLPVSRTRGHDSLVQDAAQSPGSKISLDDFDLLFGELGKLGLVVSLQLELPGGRRRAGIWRLIISGGHTGECAILDGFYDLRACLNAGFDWLRDIPGDWEWLALFE